MKKLLVLVAIGTLIVSCKTKDADNDETVTEVEVVEISDDVQNIQQTTDSLQQAVQSVEQGIDSILNDL
ncbi:MAG: hypothetical protein H6553_14100 [Chitinophagales bacterium]|nr:hypothetical protein [Chitinophagales bacterium]